MTSALRTVHVVERLDFGVERGNRGAGAGVGQHLQGRILLGPFDVVGFELVDPNQVSFARLQTREA